MVDEEKKTEAIRELYNQLKELEVIVNDADAYNDYTLGVEKYGRWLDRTKKLIAKKINLSEAEKFAPEGGAMIAFRSPREELESEAHEKHDFLRALMEEIENYPEDYLSLEYENEEKTARSKTGKKPSRIVFIVHGHDEGNLHKLKDILIERWGLEVKLLRKRPQKSRAVLDKFEQEAEDAAFAFGLFTPDDMVENKGAKYEQPRPNVFFELGWFYGKVGRNRVCIISKEGTKIPSDLEGIARIDFKIFVNEKIEEIETELKEVGLIK
ncbi:MAG: nucleotide-binding protein [bacterium]